MRNITDPNSDALIHMLVLVRDFFRMKIIVFDLDGTLINSAPDLHAAAVKMLQDFSKPELALEQVISFIGNGVPTLVRRCLEAADAEEVDYDAALESFREHYLAAPVALSRPYEGVLELLNTLASNHFKLAVCTNKSEKMTSEVLKGLDLDYFFDAVIGGDTLPVRKPSPDPLRLAFSRIGAENCEGELYVGDSEVDAETAEAVGCDFALFSNGYRKKPIDQLRTHFVFDDFKRLAEFIIGRIS